MGVEQQEFIHLVYLTKCLNIGWNNDTNLRMELGSALEWDFNRLAEWMSQTLEPWRRLTQALETQYGSHLKEWPYYYNIPAQFQVLRNMEYVVIEAMARPSRAFRYWKAAHKTIVSPPLKDAVMQQGRVLIEFEAALRKLHRAIKEVYDRVVEIHRLRRGWLQGELNKHQVVAQVRNILPEEFHRTGVNMSPERAVVKELRVWGSLITEQQSSQELEDPPLFGSGDTTWLTPATGKEISGYNTSPGSSFDILPHIEVDITEVSIDDIDTIALLLIATYAHDHRWFRRHITGPFGDKELIYTILSWSPSKKLEEFVTLEELLTEGIAQWTALERWLKSLLSSPACLASQEENLAFLENPIVPWELFRKLREIWEASSGMVHNPTLDAVLETLLCYILLYVRGAFIVQQCIIDYRREYEALVITTLEEMMCNEFGHLLVF